MERIRAGAPTLAVHRVGSGPALLLLHGFTLDHTMWDAQAAALGDVATCVVPDLRGTAGSPCGGAAVLTMRGHAADAVAVLDALGIERADVAGHSMGGYVALARLEDHPERVRSVALIGSRAAGESPDRRVRRDASVARLRSAGRAVWARELLPWLVPDDAPASVRDRVLAMIERVPEDALAAGLLGLRDRADRTHVLSTVRVPALVLCGDRDALTPAAESSAMARAMLHAAGGARLVIVPGCGHMSPMEAPAAVNHALRAFLLSFDRTT